MSAKDDFDELIAAYATREKKLAAKERATLAANVRRLVDARAPTSHAEIARRAWPSKSSAVAGRLLRHVMNPVGSEPQGATLAGLERVLRVRRWELYQP